jgi:hypothetical protein
VLVLGSATPFDGSSTIRIGRLDGPRKSMTADDGEFGTMIVAVRVESWDVTTTVRVNSTSVSQSWNLKQARHSEAVLEGWSIRTKS